MSINPSFNHVIPAVDAAALTARFRSTLGVILGGPKGFSFGRDTIEDILAQTDCVGIKVYLGLSSDTLPKLELVVVGVKEDGTDIIGIVADKSYKCPPTCGTGNILNTD